MKEFYTNRHQIILNFFNKILCGLRKALNPQHVLFKLLASWQTSLDKGRFNDSILTDLSKTYDCLPHDLLLAKLQIAVLIKKA